MEFSLNPSRYWDAVANQKNFTHPLNWDWLKQIASFRSHFLDLGCGYGRTVYELTQAGYPQVLGLDSSIGMIERGRKEFGLSQLIYHAEPELPFADESMDVIVLFAVLTCIPDSNEQEELIGEINRILRPGGVLYISDLLLNEDERNLTRYQKFADQGYVYGAFDLPEGISCRHHTEDYLRTDLLMGWEELEVSHFQVTTMNGNSSNAIQLLVRKEGLEF